MKDITPEYLEQKSRELRRAIAEMCIAHGGHIASSLSCIDILCALYHGEILNCRPENAAANDRDRFILSKGHAETALYAVLADRGFFPKSLITSEYRSGDCTLGGHPSHKIPGVEWSTGSLGHGIGAACGQALAAKTDNSPRHHFVLVGDSECTEGSIWESALFAAARNLDNLTVIIDRNHLGVLENTEDFTSLNPLADKWKAFNWKVQTCNGHNLEELYTALTTARANTDAKPSLIIAETVKGKGLPFMENKAIWHVLALNRPEDIDLTRKILAEEER